MINLGKFHRSIGVPSDYFGAMGPIFLETIEPSLVKQGMWDEETQDAWLFLFAHITRVMTHGHVYAHLDTSTNSEIRPRSKSFFSSV